MLPLTRKWRQRKTSRRSEPEMLRRDGPTLNGLTRNGVVEFKASGVASRGEESRSREGRYQSAPLISVRPPAVAPAREQRAEP